MARSTLIAISQRHSANPRSGIVHAEIFERAAHLLHPNSKVVSLKSWGCREFAILDKTTVCVVFREWQDKG